jgi:YD repeat-containing protein
MTMRIFFCGLAAAWAVSATAHATETVTYTYDARGRVVGVAHAGTVNNGLATTYTSDNADNRTQVTTTGASH